MCLGGGGASKSTKLAIEEERRRQEEINAAQRQVEAIFSSPERQQQIQDYIGAQRDYLFSDLDRTHGTNQRNLKFSLARSGLSGGSTDVDQNRLLAETYLRGVSEAERRAQEAGANLRADDQASKQTLFSQILGGADATTAAQNAGQMMRVNSQLAKQDATVNGFNSLFGDFADIYRYSRESAGERRASQEFGSLFGPRPTNQAKVAGAV